jgi:predicted transcriptional regulator
MEGNGPFRYVAGQVLKPVAFTCSPDASAGDIRERLRTEPVCVVVNTHGVVLGRVRPKDLPVDDDVRVADLMRLGPSTVQRREELSGLVERMRDKGVRTILITTPKGELLGFLDRDDAERFLAASRGAEGS